MLLTSDNGFVGSVEARYYPNLNRASLNIDPFYTGGLFHRYMLDEFICHFRDVRSIL